MKYNKAYDGCDFSDYLKYLETIREKLPKQLFDFVSNPNRHDFSEESLHDSWIKSIECISNFEAESTEIVLILVNAIFDREFQLRFKKVSEYKISQQLSDINRDLITYEIGFETDFNDVDMLVFRAMFSGDETEIEIYAGQIDIVEYIIDK